MFNLDDPGGTNPPILTIISANEMEINELGHQFIALSSYWGAGTGLTRQLTASSLNSYPDFKK